MHTPVPQKGQKHVPALDGVRGIAILMVLAVHLEIHGAIPASWGYAHQIMYSGWTGVDLFFVLSGFLITGILVDSVGASNYFRVFYARRALRIFPLYYLAVIGCIVLMPLLWRKDPQLRQLYHTFGGWVSYFLYVQNWWISMALRKTPKILGVFWSLGVEEQFYLIWPACVWLTPPPRLKLVCITGCAVALALRIFLVHMIDPGSMILLMNTFTRMDSLLMGALCALIVRDEWLLRTAKRWLAFVALFAAAGMFWIDFGAKEIWSRTFYTQSIGYTLIALFYAAFILWAYLKRVRWLSWKPLTLVGKYSYGIYVYHGFVYLILTRLVQSEPWYGKSTFPSIAYCLVSIGLSFAVAAVSYLLFESRFLRLKKYWRVGYKEGLAVAEG